MLKGTGKYLKRILNSRMLVCLYYSYLFMCSEKCHIKY